MGGPEGDLVDEDALIDASETYKPIGKGALGDQCVTAVPYWCFLWDLG